MECKASSSRSRIPTCSRTRRSWCSSPSTATRLAGASTMLADATDIAGCDAYVQHTVGVGRADETTSPGHAYHWQVQEMCYDLLNSFRNQPVFDSRPTRIPSSATGAIPSVHTRAALWQGGLRHQAAQTSWVWEEPTEPALLDGVSYGRKHRAAGRAELDLNRLSQKISSRPSTVHRHESRMLYSPACIYWDARYTVHAHALHGHQLHGREDHVLSVSDNWRRIAGRRSSGSSRRGPRTSPIRRVTAWPRLSPTRRARSPGRRGMPQVQPELPGQGLGQLPPTTGKPRDPDFR